MNFPTYPANFYEVYDFVTGEINHEAIEPLIVRFDSREDFTNIDPVRKSLIFSSEHGRLEYNSYLGMRLLYDHPPYNPRLLGRMAFNDPHAFDKEGKRLALPLHSLEAWTTSALPRDGIHTTTAAIIWPLGWRHDADIMDRIAYIEANASWFPATFHTLVLPLDEEHAELHGASATLSRKGDKATLNLVSSANSRLLPYEMEGADSLTEYFAQENDAPDWLSDGEKRLLHASKNNFQHAEFDIAIAEGADALRIPVLTYSDKPQGQRVIRFHHPDTIHSNPNLAPTQIIPLYYSRHIPSDDPREFKTAHYDELAPQSFGLPQLYLTLSREQDIFCEPHVQPAGNQEDHNLFFRPYPPEYNQGHDQQLEKEVIYKLTGSDGKQDTFYGLDVEIRLECAGEPRWQPLQLDPGEQNWLVRLTSLLGDDWRQSDLAQRPLVRFLDNYRFIGMNDSALSVMPIKHQWLGGGGDPHFDYLHHLVHEHDQLRFAGRIRHIEKLHLHGAPVSLKWTHRFPEKSAYKEISQRENKESQ